MLQVTGSGHLDWHEVWKQSSGFSAVRTHLAELLTQRAKTAGEKGAASDNRESAETFAAPFTRQLKQVTKRLFQQTWRTPSYIYSKALLCVLVALFVGFRRVPHTFVSSDRANIAARSFFNQPTSYQGLQNQMFAFFLVLTVFGQMVQQCVTLLQASAKL